MYGYYPQYQRSGINGRLVSNIEEAKAAQIDLDGSQWYFPCPSENKIYVKSINMQGIPVFAEYVITQPKAIVSNDELADRISKLEELVKEMKDRGTDDEHIATF